ncbi:hypothetical protein ACPCUV_28600 [Streptomyces platensis]|uniref:hypothetical protein n=1 Tax=Streptomyces platensis TaxID=58346 RepID=UPI003C2EDA77
MDDAFTLLRQAVDLLPEDAVAEKGVTVGDVREDIARQEWEMVLALLIEIADVHPVSTSFWEILAEAARQMMLDGSRRWCQWRGWEVRHGTVRATLTLLGTDEGGRQGAFSGDGQLRPLWDIGNRTSDGERDLNIASIWVEFARELGPQEPQVSEQGAYCRGVVYLIKSGVKEVLVRLGRSLVPQEPAV